MSNNRHIFVRPELYDENTKSNTAELSIEHIRNELRRQLTPVIREYETTPEKQYEEIEQDIWERLTIKRKKITSQEFSRPKVIYIPHDRYDEFIAKVKQKNQAQEGDDLYTDTSGSYNDTLGIIFIRYYPDNEWLNITSLCHEYAHADCLSTWLSRPDKINTRYLPSLYLQQSGINIKTLQNELGSVFEEYYATDTELSLGKEVLKKFLGEELYCLYNEIQMTTARLDQLREPELVTDIQEYSRYIIPSESTEAGIKGYFYLHGALEKIFKQIPSGNEILYEARLTGDLSKLSKAFNSYFGPGSFALAMKCDLDTFHIVLLTEYLTDTNPETKKLLLHHLEDSLKQAKSQENDPPNIRAKK